MGNQKDMKLEMLQKECRVTIAYNEAGRAKSYKCNKNKHKTNTLCDTPSSLPSSMLDSGVLDMPSFDRRDDADRHCRSIEEEVVVSEMSAFRLNPRRQRHRKHQDLASVGN